MAISNLTTGLRPGVCTSLSRPTTPYIGQLIFETDTFAMLFWNGSAWQGAVSAPAGTVNPYAGSTAPTGWLLAFGQAVSRITYANLFAVIGTTYGTGDGSTTFNLPDMRGRVGAGKDDMGGSAASRLTSTVLTASNTLGATGGTQTHTLASGESGVPAHGHNASSGAMSANASHTHTFSYRDKIVGAAGGNDAAQVQVNADNNLQSFAGDTARNPIDGVNIDHTHTVTVSNNTAANASSAHLNTQPTIVLNYIIKI